MPTVWDKNIQWPDWPTQEVGDWGIIRHLHTNGNGMVNLCSHNTPSYWRLYPWLSTDSTIRWIWSGPIKEFIWNFFNGGGLQDNLKISSLHKYCWDHNPKRTSKYLKCIYDSGICEFDRAMANVSIGLAHDLVVDRSIRNFRVRITRSGYATRQIRNTMG